MKKVFLITTASTVLMLVLLSLTAWAHCDTMDGPVVKAAKSALEKGDIIPVLQWIKKEHENEVRSAFKRTLEVRTKGKEAQELADMYFFETVVRLHRAGEGEPYTGVKPAGTPIEPIVLMADKSLETGDIKELTQHLTTAFKNNLVLRFNHALEAKKEADKSIELGREFVEAYVEFVHYAEQLFESIQKTGKEQAHGKNMTPAHEVH